MKAWDIRHQGPKSQIRLGRGLLLSTKILTTIKIRSSRREPGTCSTAGVGLCFPPWELSDPFPFPSLPHSGENLHTPSSQWREVAHSCSHFPHVTLLPNHCLITVSPFSARSPLSPSTIKSTQWTEVAHIQCHPSPDVTPCLPLP